MEGVDGVNEETGLELNGELIEETNNSAQVEQPLHPSPLLQSTNTRKRTRASRDTEEQSYQHEFDVEQFQSEENDQTLDDGDYHPLKLYGDGGRASGRSSAAWIHTHALGPIESPRNGLTNQPSSSTLLPPPSYDTLTTSHNMDGSESPLLFESAPNSRLTSSFESDILLLPSDLNSSSAATTTTTLMVNLTDSLEDEPIMLDLIEFDTSSPPHQQDEPQDSSTQLNHHPQLQPSTHSSEDEFEGILDPEESREPQEQIEDENDQPGSQPPLLSLDQYPEDNLEPDISSSTTNQMENSASGTIDTGVPTVDDRHQGRSPPIDHRCSTCHKSFLEGFALRRHMKIHAPPEFGCLHPGCGKFFVDAPKLRRHFLTHTGEKAFKCKFHGCNQTFSLAHNLKAHQTLVHKNERPYRCVIPRCGHGFARKLNLKLHYHSHRPHHRNGHLPITDLLLDSIHDSIAPLTLDLDQSPMNDHLMQQLTQHQHPHQPQSSIMIQDDDEPNQALIDDGEVDTTQVNGDQTIDGVS